MDLELAQFIATLMASITPALLVAWLALRKQQTDKPLTAAQAVATKTEGLRNEFDIMEQLAARQALSAEKQLVLIETLRGDVLRATNTGEERIAALRIETEARLVKHDLASQTEIKRLQDQLTAQGLAAKEQSDKQEGLLTTALAKIESLESELKGARREISDLNKMLMESRKETAEAKEDSTDKTEIAAPSVPTVPLPFPVTIVPPEPAA